MSAKVMTISLRVSEAQYRKVLEVSRRLGSEGNTSVGARWLIQHAPIKRLPPVRTEATTNAEK